VPRQRGSSPVDLDLCTRERLERGEAPPFPACLRAAAIGGGSGVRLRLAIISYHASPVATPGAGVNGGMNVYVRSLASHLARAGVACDVFTRAPGRGSIMSRRIEPGFVLHSVPAGRGEDDLFGAVPEFTARVLDVMDRSGDAFAAVHANYWLSGVAAHTLKHELSIPLVTTFHTLERAKGLGAPLQSERVHQEARILGCSDVVLASGPEESRWLHELYQAPSDKIVELPLGVDRAYFSPGPSAPARAAVGIEDDLPILLVVGRIQPLKGTSLAVEALASLRSKMDARLVIIGGPSGPEGAAEERRVRQLVADEGLAERVLLVPPVPHELLSTYYRAADLVVVPSKSESFGLVALEAAACGRPVVATDVGGLRSIVADDVTGLLVPERTPTAFAERIAHLLAHPLHRARMGCAAARHAGRFTWRQSAERMIELVESLEGVAASSSCTA